MVVTLGYREQQRRIRLEDEPDLGRGGHEVEIDADRTHEDGIVGASARNVALPQPGPGTG
jgi:hypothetical protein